MDRLINLSTQIKSWLFTAAAMLLVLFGAYVAGGRAARRATEIDKLRQNINNRRRADHVQTELDALDDDGITARARRWVRGNGR